MIRYLVSCVLGILSGILTGLVPGVHPNTVIFTSLPVYLSTGIGKEVYISFMTGLSVSHTFHDFLPAIFLSAPEAESALSVVAAPEMVQEGRGLEAFKATVSGGITSFAVILMLLTPLYFLLEPVYTSISGVMPYILLFFLFYIVLSSESMRDSVLVVLFSGALGIISFQASLNQQFVLVPIFSGLFAVPGLYSIISEEEFEIPEQKQSKESLVKPSISGVTGTLAGLLAGTIPGIGAAVSTSFLSPLMEGSKKDFLTAMGAVNTSDILFSLISLYLLGNPRSGISVALQSIITPGIEIIVTVGILTSFSVVLSALIALRVGKVYVDTLKGFRVNLIALPVLGILLIVTAVLLGGIGFLVLFISSSIGFYAQRTDQRRSCMAVLIIPSILSFAGITLFI